MTSILFQSFKNTFVWQNVKTFFVRSQYNELMTLVFNEYVKQYPRIDKDGKVLNQPKFLDAAICLTLVPCTKRGGCEGTLSAAPTKTMELKADADKLYVAYQDAEKELVIAQKMHSDEATKAKTVVAGKEAIDLSPIIKEYEKKRNMAQSAYNLAKMASDQAIIAALSLDMDDYCKDTEGEYLCMPVFKYIRKQSLPKDPVDADGQKLLDLSYKTNGLTIGALMWLYYYERMGIFKILGVLMDDYNYRGKYTISGSRKDSKGFEIPYSTLMDTICTLYRAGISSNQRDRICTYQRVLGVSIENNLGIDSEKNVGFMQTFSKLIDYMLEYYKAKQLATAINTGNQIRSSVATQTSIRDTINLLQQQFEPLQYGRNQVNTFLGIATVHATLCLVNLLRKEIGIPDQYDKPEEFIPAAYDILVTKSARSFTLSESNRFIVFDNCASYGYRLLTDIETLDLSVLSTAGNGSKMDVWLDDVENLVEGYRNAYASVPEGVEAIV